MNCHIYSADNLSNIHRQSETVQLLNHTHPRGSYENSGYTAEKMQIQYSEAKRNADKAYAKTRVNLGLAFSFAAICDAAGGSGNRGQGAWCASSVVETGGGGANFECL